MDTVFVGDDVEVDALLARRRALGLDGRDEVWEGVYRVTPYEHARNTQTAWRLGRLLEAAADAAGLECLGPFNLGTPQDFRIPDMGLVALDATVGLYNDTAAIVIEVLSPNDDTFRKFGFYAAHGVQELWVVDPLARTVRIWQLGVDGASTETGRSDVLGLTAATVQTELSWPRS